MGTVALQSTTARRLETTLLTAHADSAVDGRGIAHGIRNAKDKVFEGKTDDRFCHDVHKGSDQAGKEHAASQGGRSI